MDHNEIDLEINNFNNKKAGGNTISLNTQNLAGYNNNIVYYNKDNFNKPARDNQTNFNNATNNFNNNNNNINDSPASLEQLKEKNKQINLDKIGFYKFLIYSTKAEIQINSFKDLLYWVSLLEIFLYIISILLFISSPSNFYIFWTFTTHAARGVIGMLLLFRIPDSHLSVENIDAFDSSSIESLQEQMASNYITLLQNNESRIKPFLIVYFILTLVNIVVDIIVFAYLIAKWDNQEYSLSNIIGLLLIVIFFSMILNMLLIYNFKP